MEKSDNIVEAIRKDRKIGAERLVIEYKDRLYGIAFGLCGDAAEAEDLVFRTFEQVIARIDDYHEEDAFFGWMHTILRNYYLMSQRGNVSRKTVPVGGLDEMDEIAGSVDADTVVAAIDGDILRKVVDRLPAEMREVVVLHYFMNQPIGKIAKILSIAKGTVKSRLYYARLAIGMRLGVAIRKPAVALIAAGFFISAAFAATFMVLEHPQLEEVDEPIYLDDASLVFEDGFQDEGDPVATMDAVSSAAAIACCPTPPDASAVGGHAPACSVRAKVSASFRLKDFRSSFKAVQTKPISSFSSIAANPATIAIR